MNQEDTKGKGWPTGMLGGLIQPWTWLMAWRDARSEFRRLFLFAFSVSAGIAALVSIHSLRATLESGLDQQSRALLGSDLMISSRDPFPAEVIHKAASFAEEISLETSFSTLLSFPHRDDEARLVQLRVIEGNYPFYGNIESDPPDAVGKMRERKGLLLEPALLDQYDLKPEDIARLGNTEVKILGASTKAAPRSGRFTAFAPEAYANEEVLEASGLLEGRSLTRHYLHLKLSADKSPTEIIAVLKEMDIQGGWGYETPEDRREQIGEVLDQFEQFLALIGIVSLILGSIGVASAIQIHIRRRQNNIAVLRCLGAPASLSYAIFLVQSLVLGFLATVAGATVGVFLHAGTLAFFADRLPVTLALWPTPWVVLTTTVVGFITCAGFALIPLFAIRHITPARALRAGFTQRKMIPLKDRLSVLPVYGLIIVAIVTLAVLSSATPLRGIQLCLGLAVAFLLLWLTAYILRWLTFLLVRPSWPYLLRQGISNLHRPGNQTLLFLLSLGLGVFLVLSVLLSQNLLMQQIQISEREDGPNVYLVDVQSDQLDGITQLLREKNLPEMEAARMVTMRIAQVKGVPQQKLREEGEVPPRVLRREYRSSYRHHLNDTELTREGRWPPVDWDGQEPIPISLESGIASDLGLQLGDSMTIDVQGIPLETAIHHIRDVDWSRFNLNFFMLFPYNVLEEAPGFYVVTTRIPEGQTSGQLQRSLVLDFPNVTAIDLSQILETIRDILYRLSLAIQILAGFTVVAGLAILSGTIVNGRDQKIHESVLLRTLGASRKQVRTILFWEYATLGFLSSLTGSVLAIAGHWAMARYLFDTAFNIPVHTTLTTLFVATATATLVGGFLSRGVCAQSPLAVLRRE